MANLFEKLLANLAFFSAASAAGMASFWNVYQPKEPKTIRK